MFKSLVNEIKKHKDSFIEILVAFLLSAVGLVLLSLSILVYKQNDSKVYMNGLTYFFGDAGFPLSANLQGFLRLFTFACPILGLVLTCTSYFYKKLKGMSSLFLIVSAVLVITIPNTLDPSGTLFAELPKLTAYAYSSMALFFLAAVLLFMSEYKNENYSVAEIAEISILLAFSILGNYLKISFGYGSINLQILPLAFIALRNNSSKTFLATGIIYGLITCLLDGYGLHTYPMEYLIAFGSVSILSLGRHIIFKNGKPSVLGGFMIAILLGIATVIRYFAASFDSVYFYSVTWTEALIYNAGYVFITGAGSIVILEILYIKPLFLLNKRFPPIDYKLVTGEEKVVSDLEQELIDQKLIEEINKFEIPEENESDKK